MALLFSAVTVTAGEDEIELLVGGCALPGFVDSKNEEKTERIRRFNVLYQ